MPMDDGRPTTLAAISSSLAVLAVAVAAARQPTRPAPHAHWLWMIDPTARCAYAVPPGWKVDEAIETATASLAYSPDGYATATASWLSIPTSWSAFAARQRDAVRSRTVHADTPQRLWLEYRTSGHNRQHFLAVPAAGGACAIWADLDDRSDGRLASVVSEILATLTALP
jgi:hypothetical protein